jgi:hypothetical protein
MQSHARTLLPALRRLALAAMALLPLAACATLSAPKEGCAANALCAARAAEPDLISASHGLAERQGDILAVHPANAPIVGLADHKAACDNGDADKCEAYALVGNFPKARALVVQQFLYEGSSFFLIDDNTGRQTRLAAMPAFSPDGTRFLVAPYDEENDTGPNHLEIWRREGDGAVLEWAHSLEQEHAEDPALPAPYQTRLLHWRGDSLALEFFTDDGKSWRGSLTRAEDGWRLDAQSPPGLFAAR